MNFVVTRAAAAPALVNAMVAGQHAAMQPYGIAFVVNPNVNPDACLIAAEIIPNIVVGGLRLEVRTPDHQLPLETEIDPPEATQRKLDARMSEGLVELCGMWVIRKAGVPHLPDRLVHLGIAVAAAMGMGHMVAFGGKHSLPLALRTGFHFEEGEPVFPFPTPSYHSRLVWLRLPRG